MILFPAIDIIDGKAVRLARGDFSERTDYDADPLDAAKRWVDAGARALHVVDLDGAFGAGENQLALRAICAAVDVPVQTGGGVRTLSNVQERVNAGAATVVLGTVLIEDPAAARAIVAAFGERIVAGIDARGDRVATRGWQNDAGVSRDDLVRDVAAWGIGRIVYTEIARDGMGSGYDVAALAHVAALAPVRFTASGGAKTLADLEAVCDGTPPNVDAAIIGRALYEGTLDLHEALNMFT
jgi:phosphoribosylformimino-5-aminoimidazole carboxamide ribotide isomerase